MKQVDPNPNPSTTYGARTPDTPPGELSAQERLPHLEQVFDSAPVGLCLIGLDLRYITVNECFATMFERTREHFTGRTVCEALPALADQIMAHLEHSLTIESQASVELALTPQGANSKKAHSSVYLHSVQPARNASGTLIGFAVALVDITERKAAEAALRESETDFRYTVELNPHLPWSANADGSAHSISSRYKDFIGFTSLQAHQGHWKDRLHPEDRDRAFQTWTKSVQSGHPYDTTYRLHTADGSYRWMRSRAFPRRDETGKIVRWYGTIEDIHERTLIDEALRTKTARLEEVSAQLALLVREDHLTGLANRRHFDDAFEREMSRARRAHHPLSLLMFDVDFFKRYNDTFGHPAGDVCLRDVGLALKKALRRQGDLAARYGGEEFVVLLPDTPEEGAMEVARFANDAIRSLNIHHPVSATGFLTVSVGVASFDPHQDLAHRNASNNLLQMADLALYAAKSAGRNCTIGSRELNELSTLESAS